MSRKFERRLAALELRLKASAPGTMEIVVRGGLGPGVTPIAGYSGRQWEPAPDESFEAFCARAKAVAEAEGRASLLSEVCRMCRRRRQILTLRRTREQLAALADPRFGGKFCMRYFKAQ